MNGPYDWVPPNYWYDKAHSDSGGAWGFNSETTAGPDIPTHGHAATDDDAGRARHAVAEPERRRSTTARPSSTFGNLKLFGNALDRPVRRSDGPDRLREEGAAGAVRERARRVRVAQPELHRLVEPVDRADLLDAQQRLDLAALAAVRHLPGSERRVLRCQEGQRAAAHPVLLRHQVRCRDQPIARRLRRG